MSNLDRRTFLAMGGAAAPGFNMLRADSGSSMIDDTLRSGIARRKVPAVVGMVANGKKTLYSGAFGVRDSSGTAVRTDSIFRIASMTKAVTTVAALQLVEQGKVQLDEPVARHLPEFNKLQVLQGFDANGTASLRPAVTP